MCWGKRKSSASRDLQEDGVVETKLVNSWGRGEIGDRAPVVVANSERKISGESRGCRVERFKEGELTPHRNKV